MTSAKTIAVLTLLAAPVSSAAIAGDWTNSAAYNGGTASQNQASSYSMRDANGNLTMVDGRVTSSTYSQGSGAQWAGGGVGGGGGGLNAYGQATAIGNQLNVVVIGSRNTTIVDSTQINNGNQTAAANLNKH